MRSVPPPADAPDALRQLSPLTAKPVLYVANVAEGGDLEPPAALRERGHAVASARAWRPSWPSSTPTRRRRCARSWGWPSRGSTTVVREAFALLDLIVFFTADRGKEARARAIARGTPARRAAGAVHTDMERGFVAAEVIGWDELVEAGGYAAGPGAGAAAGGGPRLPGADGEVVNFRFTP